MNFYRGMLETTLLVVIGLACADVRGTNSGLTYAKSTRDKELIRFYGPDRRLSGNSAFGLHSIDQAEWKDESDKAKEETLAASREKKKSFFQRLYQFFGNMVFQRVPEPEESEPDGKPKWRSESMPASRAFVHPEPEETESDGKSKWRSESLPASRAFVHPEPEKDIVRSKSDVAPDEQPEAYESKSQSSDPTPQEKPKPKSGSSITGFLSDFERAAEQDSHFPDWLVAFIIMVAALSSLCCCCTCFFFVRMRSIAERRRRDNEEHSVRVLERLLDRDVGPTDFAPRTLAARAVAPKIMPSAPEV